VKLSSFSNEAAVAKTCRNISVGFLDENVDIPSQRQIISKEVNGFPQNSAV
jgi:hypothetical protein